ncbi:unnamed protein product [Darwinula stevensoni]|uniref:Large ribosomal subunit protein mL40 n=1 Tax=Darwinula stevensoni TaxID=69355 RepID=A0A7R8X8Y7_9CRUS|nr:unnamed protein product [Darwinula stevensoni]CAG0890142.1 unnamed protein product [Darwinula stevensoni]
MIIYAGLYHDNVLKRNYHITSVHSHEHKSGSLPLTKAVGLSSIKEFLSQSMLPYKEGFTCLIVDCPVCNLGKGKKKSGETFPLYINNLTGMWMCPSCQLNGSWNDFCNLIALPKPKAKQREWVKHAEKTEPVPEEIQALFENSQPIKDLTSEGFSELMRTFKLNHQTREVLERLNVRYDMQNKKLIFPSMSPHSMKSPTKVRVISSVDGGVTEQSIPKDSLTLIGLENALSHDTVVLTLSLLDMIAIHQMADIPAVCLPQGTKKLPQEVLPALEHFNKIILWFQDDIHSWEAVRAFARKLNESRCYYVNPATWKWGPFQAMHKKVNIPKILYEAWPVAHKSIASFPSLREHVKSELALVEQVSGVKWKRFPILNRLLKGHRRGELTVFTGPTGAGKTTFMSEYSLDLCLQGVNTLWGSFEVHPVRLAKIMLIQFAQLSLEKHPECFDEWADKFEDLTMYFISLHGQNSIKSVLDVMTHAVYVYDIAHVIVDNLQFMLGTPDDQRGNFDRFYRQDLAVAAFRKFATQNNCHVSLVIHPRKEGDMDELTTSSIFGGAKASQEADNVLILQDRRLSSLRGKKYIQVTKNRFSGDLGIMPLEFDKESRTFSLKKKPKKDHPEKETAEPLKKKKRLDPAILKAREDRRKRKIEKQIRRLEKVAQQYKPVDECEVSPTLRKEISMRKRNAPMSESELAEAAQLLCEWTRYRWKESCDELITIDSIVSSRLKALEELRKESPRLYEAAIQLDENLLPYKATGPVESPPIAGYDPPDGEYIDTTKNLHSKMAHRGDLTQELDFILNEDERAESQGREEEEEEEMMTAREVVDRLEEAWLNEKWSPELLEPQMELVDCMLEQITQMEENLNRISRKDLRYSVHHMELQRIRYVVSSYLRHRLEKIEKFAPAALNSEGTFRERLSEQELKFATEYTKSISSHMQSLVIQHMPLNLQEIQPTKVYPAPNRNRFVLAQVKQQCPRVLVDEDEGAEVDFDPGTQHIVQYRAVSQLLKDGAVKLV